MNKIYFIGAGPGELQYLTLQGAEALAAAAVVYLSLPYDQTFAERLLGKEIFIPFDYDFADLLSKIDKQLEQAPVAFLIPGDLTFFSPYQAIVNHFGDRAEVIAGVGVANAAAAHIKRTLDLPAVCNRAIIVSPKILAEQKQSIEQMAAPGVTLLIYMNHLPLSELVAKLRRGYGRDVPIALFHRLGLADARVIQASLDTIVAACNGVDYFYLTEPEKKPALTFLVVGETLVAEVDGEWWDNRRKTDWNKRKDAAER